VCTRFATLADAWADEVALALETSAVVVRVRLCARVITQLADVPYTPFDELDAPDPTTARRIVNPL